MSDEHEGHDHPHIPGTFSFFTGPTKEQVEQHEMEMVTTAHETRSFLDSLDVTQLRKLSGVLSAVINSDGTAGVFYQGMITAFIDLKYKECMACRKNHEQELADLSGQVAPTEEPTFPLKGSKKYDELMYLYGVEGDDGGTDKVMCVNCQKWYETLQDRTLRSPGKAGCSGCIEKEKWG